MARRRPSGSGCLTPVSSPPDDQRPGDRHLGLVDRVVVADHLVQEAVLGLRVPVGLDDDRRRGRHQPALRCRRPCLAVLRWRPRRPSVAARGRGVGCRRGARRRVLRSAARCGRVGRLVVVAAARGHEQDCATIEMASSDLLRRCFICVLSLWLCVHAVDVGVASCRCQLSCGSTRASVPTASLLSQPKSDEDDDAEQAPPGSAPRTSGGYWLRLTVRCPSGCRRPCSPRAEEHARRRPRRSPTGRRRCGSR